MFWKTLILFVISPALIFFDLKVPEKPVNEIVPVEEVDVLEITSPATEKENKEVITGTETTETVIPEVVKNVTEKENEITVQSDKPVEITPIPTPKEFTPNFEEINTFAREATVNILCSTQGNELSPISGTGVVVDPRGLILTNAHIGQYLLLKDFRKKDFVECTIRTGSPAYPRYKIELVYISPAWIERNKALLKQSNPTGTGENDFAFLRITERIDGNPVTNLPYIVINTREFIEKEEPVLLSSYPAGFLGGISILQDLHITSAIARVEEVFTFSENLIDLISIPGTIVSQKGSSGGAVVDRYKTLLGIISTSSDGEKTSDRNLYAITGAYINRTLQNEVGIDLVQFLNYDLAEFAKIFNETTSPALSKIIVDELSKP